MKQMKIHPAPEREKGIPSRAKRLFRQLVPAGNGFSG
jgi:hypothetical protein